MKILRASIMAAVLLLGGATASARNVNALLINRTDGVTDKIAIHQQLNITQAENGDILMVHPNITVAYPCELVKNMTAGFQSFPTGTYYYGDKEVKDDAISSPEVDGLTFSISPDEIRISGVNDASVKLIDLKGSTLLSVDTQGGEAIVRTSGIPSGVYLLSAGKTTLKVKL